MTKACPQPEVQNCRALPEGPGMASFRDIACFFSCAIFSLALLALANPVGAQTLSANQQQSAAAIANQVAWDNDEVVLVDHPLGLQTLFVEKQENKKTNPVLRARVFQYDYSRNAARVVSIDLLTDTIERVQVVDSVHLPLNAAEIDYAISVLSRENQLLELMRQEQIRRGQPVFESLAELEVKASIFEPNSGAHRCASERCVLLSLFDQTNTVFTAEPVVYMHSASVQLLQGQ